MRGEDRSISETMTLPGPPRGWSEGVGGGISEAGEEGSGAASSELVSPSSPRREEDRDWDRDWDMVTVLCLQE